MRVVSQKPNEERWKQLTIGFHNRENILGLDKSSLSETVERGTHLIGEGSGEEGEESETEGCDIPFNTFC